MAPWITTGRCANDPQRNQHSSLSVPQVNYPGDSPLGQMDELYDPSSDIGERENPADEHSEVVEQLGSELANWNRQRGALIWPSSRSTLYVLHGQILQQLF